jgi:hypothetical protein
MQWLLRQFERETDACIMWPWRTNGFGYGIITHNGKQLKVSRLVCAMVHGSAPKGKNDSCHSCGKRACVNKRHLRWDTRAGNFADKVRHGTHNGGERSPRAKLTAKQVVRIRALLQAGKKQNVIASRFGVHQSTISYINSGHTWGGYNK